MTRAAQCNAAGLGLLTAAVAALGQKKCIEGYESQGYHQAPLPESTTNTVGKKQADQCNTYGGGTGLKEQLQQTCVGGPATTDPAPTDQAGH